MYHSSHFPHIEGRSAVIRQDQIYSPIAARFDGTNDYLTRGAGLTGAADSKAMTFSCWVKVGADGSTMRILRGVSTVGGTVRRVAVSRETDNTLNVWCANATDTNILSLNGTTATIADGWVHVLISFDLTDTAKRHFYVNDASGLSVSVWTNDTIDFTIADWAIGAVPNGTEKFNGDIADLWFMPGTYIDLSIEANRRNFISEDGKPVYLGPNGNYPTGSAPLIFLSGATSSWHTNKGTGGGFTVTGALTESTTSPSDHALLAGEPDGMEVDFTLPHPKMLVKDTGTPTNNFSGHPDGWFTNSGTSPKMVKGPLGYLEWSPHNLCLQSQDFNTTWTKSGIAVTTNAATAPDGTLTADKLIADTDIEYHYIYQPITSTVVSAPYTTTVYAKAAGHTTFELQFKENYTPFDDVVGAAFDLATGVISYQSSASSGVILDAEITDAGNGWFRCSVTGTVPRDQVQFLINVPLGTVAGDGTSGIYFWGAQLNRGYVPTKYLATTSAAKFGLGINYGEGLVVEAAATNQHTRSHEFNDSFWFKNNITVTTDSTTAPDGSLTADRLECSSGNAMHGFYRNSGITTTANIDYAHSIYLKRINHDFVTVIGSNWAAATGGWFAVTVNLATGEMTQIADGSTGVYTGSSIDALGDGWFRVALIGNHQFTSSTLAVEFSNSDTPTHGSFGDITWNATGTEQVYVWGAQFETPPDTSYIPTYGATVTRAIDNVFGDLDAAAYNWVEGTVYLDAVRAIVSGGVDRRLCVIEGGGDSKQFYVLDSDGLARIFDFANGSAQGSIANGFWIPATRGQMAYGYKLNEMGLSFNGGAVATDTAGTMFDPEAATTIHLGRSVSDGVEWVGHIRKVVYVPRRVSNADLPTWRYDGAYTALPVTFDGNDQLSVTGGLTGAADSKMFTVSFWLKMDVDGTQDAVLFTPTALDGSTVDAILIWRQSDNSIEFLCDDTAGVDALNIASSPGSVTIGRGWVHVLCSVDLSDTTKRHIYINDTFDLADVTTYVNTNIDWTCFGQWVVGARNASNSRMNGSIADLWFQMGLYTDFSIEANRRKFINADGTPVYLGSAGQNPTGTSPIIFMSGAESAWHTNKGTGGGFTETGAMTASSSTPVAVIKRPELEFIGTAEDTLNDMSWVFPNQNLGISGRKLVIVMVLIEGGAESDLLNSGAIAGVTATVNVTTPGAASTPLAAIMSAVVDVPVGDITVSISTIANRCHISVWQLTNYSSVTPISANNALAAMGPTSSSITLNLPPNSVGIAGVALGQPDSPVTWNIGEKMYEATVESNMTASGAQIAGSDGNGSTVVTATFAQDLYAMVGAVWT